MRETLAALYSHARRWAPGLDVPFFVPPVRIEALDARRAGEFRIDEESYASVAVSAQHVGDANAVLLILAHEACHDILRQSQLNHPDNVELDEITTDLATFICGFGDLVLRGHSRIGHSRIRPTRGSGAHYHFGYLSSHNYQEAHAYVLSLREAQKLPGRFDLAKPMAAGAPLDISALLADMLDDASLSLNTPPPVKDAEPPVPSQRSAPRFPSQGGGVRGPLKRPKSPFRAAKKGMSEEFEWIELDEKMARRQGFPALIPVPRSQRKELAEEGLNVDLCRQWVSDFLRHSEAGKSAVWRKKNAAIVSSLEAFVDKGPLWDKVQTAFAENDYARAITALKRIASMAPDDHAARLDLASALANTGDHPGALKAFKAIKRTFEGDPDYHVDVGHVHLALKDKDSALSEMALALEAEPDCQAALDAMAQMGIRDVAEYLSDRRAEAAAKAEEKARAIATAKAEEKARAIAAAKAEEKARLEGLAKIKRANANIDTPPRSPDGFEPPKVVPGMLDTSRLPELSDRQRQRMIERGKQALAEAAAKPEEPLAEALAEPEKPLAEALAEPEKPLAEPADELEKLLAEAVAEPEKPLAEAAAEPEIVPVPQEKALAKAADRIESAAEAEDGARADALAATKGKTVDGAKEMALDEAAAKAMQRARSVRQAVLLVAALIIAVALVVLGRVF
jgi:hypothetical protein